MHRLCQGTCSNFHLPPLQISSSESWRLQILCIVHRHWNNDPDILIGPGCFNMIQENQPGSKILYMSIKLYKLFFINVAE